MFSLISQEEKQRTVSSGSNLGKLDSVNDMAFMVRNDSSKRFNGNSSNSNGNIFSKKERPFFTHCNFHGHTIEKCYKIHGYPPGYKQK